jgi:hypothetical protein
MATIDPRITPLVETLISAGADFIALEILIAIQRGMVDEDTEDELREVREAVGHFRQGNQPAEFKSSGETKVRHLNGEEQIEFAAEYVIERITRELGMADASIENLNRIANGAEDNSPKSVGSPSIVSLRWIDTEVRLDREQIENTREQLITLREALSAWSTSAREEGQSK